MNKIVRISFLLLVLPLLVIVAGCSADAKKARHLSRANHYYDAGQYPSAEVEYMNVLRFELSNPQANTRLGLIYYEEGRLQRAAYFLSRASQLTPDNVEVRKKLGFLLAAYGQYSNAIAQASFVLDKAPQDDEGPILLAEASVLPKDAAAARQRLETMAKNGDRATTEVALGNLALREHDVTTAAVDFKKAQAMDPKSSAVNVALASLAWAQGDLKQADAFFKAAADASPIRSPRRMQYVRFKVQTGDIETARSLLSDITKAAPDYVPAFRTLAEVAATEKKYDESNQILENILKLDPDNFDALFFQAQLDTVRGQPDQCVSHLERMARVYPQVAAVHYQLGAAYVAVNDMSKAAASFNRALEINPDFVEATIMLAQIQMRNGNADSAILALQRVRQKYPQMVEVQLVLADAYRARNRVSDALVIYDKLENQYPTNIQVRLLHAVALLGAKDEAGAHKVFDQILELSPGNFAAIEQLVKLDVERKQFDAASRLLNSEIQKAPKRTDFRLLSASVLVAEEKYPESQNLLSQILQLEPTNQNAELLLAQSYSSSGQNEKALAQAGAVLAQDPSNISALMVQAAIYSSLKDNKNAADTYEKVLKINPKFAPALNNLAYVYTEYLNDLDRAYDLAQRAHDLLPNDPSTADTLGWVSFKRGSYDTALGFLKASVGSLPVPEAQFHYGMACYMTGDEADARTALQQAWQAGVDFPERSECGECLSVLTVNPDTADAAVRAKLEKRVSEKADDPIALSRLARIYLHQGDVDKAITAYEALLQATPKSLDVMVNLVRLYTPKDPKKAYDMAKAANKLAPDDATVSRLLGHLAFVSGDYRLAANVLQQAVQGAPNDASSQFDYALAAYSVGKVAAAQSALQNALAANLQSPQSDQARQMLDMLNFAAAPSQAAAAMARINAILKAQPDYVPALMARAASDTSAAADACEKALAKYPDFAPAAEQLARIYAADPAKLDRAYALASKAHDSLPDDPVATKTMGIILIQRADYVHAASLLKQSASKLASDPEVFYYLGLAQYHLKDRAGTKTNLQQALALNLPAQLVDSARQMLNDSK